jgi:Predicted integral membrane protein (DUF2269)
VIQLFLFLHIGGAIVAFGPTFALPLMGAMSGKEPQHANFAARATGLISQRRIIPFALSMAVTGGLLIWSTGRDLTSPSNYWLDVAIVIYVIAIGYALMVQAPAGRKLVDLTSRPPEPGATGPSPELVATVKRLRQGTLGLMGAVTVIVALMVFKPGA